MVCCTIRMPDPTRELHGWWHEWIILGKLQLGREDTTLVWCVLGALDKGFPDKKIILVDGAGVNAIRRVGS